MIFIIGNMVNVIGIMAIIVGGIALVDLWISSFFIMYKILFTLLWLLSFYLVLCSSGESKLRHKVARIIVFLIWGGIACRCFVKGVYITATISAIFVIIYMCIVISSVKQKFR